MTERQTISGEDRRRFFRIDDRVGLQMEPIPANAEAEAIASFESASARVGLLNSLRAMRDQHLPQQRALETRFPTVAAYVKVLEQQIDTLALALLDGTGLQNGPATAVNLSAQGLRVPSAEPLPVGTLVALTLTLFPESNRIELLARVTASHPEESGAAVCLEFSHIRDADREAIIRHVHAVQRERLRAHAEAAE